MRDALPVDGEEVETGEAGPLTDDVVVTAREDLEIRRQVFTVLSGA